MVTFECGDVMPGCEARFRAADDDYLYAQIARHAVHMHSFDDLDPTWFDLVRASIAVDD